MTGLALSLLTAYLLGSLSGSLLLGRLRGVDIRAQGSGNAGGTNAFRTQGWRFALGVVVIDIGKGALTAWFACRLLANQPELLQIGPLAAALAVVCGHVWPVFHGFRGGKGAATLVGGLLVLWPWSLPWLLGAWALVLAATGYVGLSTVIAGAVLVPVAAADGPWQSPRMLFALIVALLLAFTHRSNLARLRAGNEFRFERARVFHRLWTRARG